MIHWVAHYDDGERLDQSQGGVYGDIDRARLVAFDLLLTGRLVLRLDLHDRRKQLIWRIRHRQDTAGNHAKIHVAGWKMNGVEAICYVFEDGVVLLSDFNGHDFMHPVEPLPCEREITVYA